MGRLFEKVGDRAYERPWLLFPPLLGLLVQNVLNMLTPGSSGAVALKTMITALLTALVTTVFAELWIGDGKSIDPGRLVETGTVYLLPYPLLLVFGAATTPFVYWLLHTDMPNSTAIVGLYAVLGIGKLTAFAAGTVSSLAAVKRRDSTGALASLKFAFAALWRNAWFFLLLLGSFWLIQEACVYLSRQLFPGILSGFFTTAIPLLGCVAFPIESWRAGRLK